jgi:hypothetical protein
MSASTAIGMVSESLRNLLVGEMTIIPAPSVTVLAPDEPAGGNRRVNLFLYKAQENASLKNLDWQPRRGNSSQLAPPPLSLNLFYLMTPYAPNDPQTGNSAAHEILGEAMRVFYENPIVSVEYLAEGLADANQQIKIMLNTLDLDELSRVWNTFTQPFRLSVLYEVSVVQIDMLTESERAMAARVRTIGVPAVRAPFSPPVIHTLTPTSGPAGTTLTFFGEYLSGWRAYATVMRTTILNGVEITGESFDVALPGDLDAGFHEIRVDVSHLFRKTFFFEVTP